MVFTVKWIINEKKQYALRRKQKKTVGKIVMGAPHGSLKRSPINTTHNVINRISIKIPPSIF